MPAPDRKRRLTAFVVAMAVLIVTPLAVVASDRFTDVPDSNIFHDDIQWLADADVTRGCNPPTNDRFCPEDNVTRQQMAAFMKRLAENQVVDAGTLDGLDSTEVMPVVAADVSQQGFFESATEPTILNTVTIQAPDAGILIVSGSAFLRNSTGAGADIALQAYVDGDSITPHTTTFDVVEGTGKATSQLAYTVAIEVPAGSHLVEQAGGIMDDFTLELIDGNWGYNRAHLVVEWMPRGSVTLTSATGGTGSASGN